MVGSIRTFSSPLEEKPDNKHLQPSHRHHHQSLNHTKVEDPSLRAADSAEVAVLARPEVFLVPRDGRQLRGQFENRLFQSRRLLGARALSRGELRAFFVLDLQKTIIVSQTLTDRLDWGWAGLDWNGMGHELSAAEIHEVTNGPKTGFERERAAASCIVP